MTCSVSGVSLTADEEGGKKTAVTNLTVYFVFNN